MFKVTYNGVGVATNKLGAFQHGTTANTPDEAVAREIAAGGEAVWTVTAPDGSVLGATAPVRGDDRRILDSFTETSTDSESFGRREKRKRSDD